jgi:hypothetical protein
VRRAIPASESCTLSQSKSDSPALLIYDCRSAPNLKDSVFSNVFVAIAREAAIQGMDAFIHASVLSRASRTSIEEVGFRLKPA